MSSKISIVILILAFNSQILLSQNTASISGKITDLITSEPLIGANVMLKGSSIGTATDLKGNYSIHVIPIGSYVLQISYIGYRTESIEIKIENTKPLERNIKLSPVTLESQPVVVTAQASGQNAAINKEIASQNIVDIVSAARIQELPDVNAAESVGRLPGVYLLRSGGEGYAVAVRGLQPKYNKVMINGVPIPPTSATNRMVNMSMISSNILGGIEVFKTVTPDMDAAVLGGVINFKIRRARKKSFSSPEIALTAQGGYNNLQNSYNEYKFTGTIGDRFFKNNFGILFQALVEDANRTSAELDVNYKLLTYNYGEYNPMELRTLTPTYHPRKRSRYGVTLTMDYRLPDGEIDLMNFFSSSYTKAETRSLEYDFYQNEINYISVFKPTKQNNITNLLDFKHKLFSLDMDIKLSHSYTENINPESWIVDFLQTPNLSDINPSQNPVNIARIAQERTNLEKMYFNNLSTSNSFKKQRDFRMALDIKKSFNVSDFISTTLKFGGMYKFSDVYYDYNIGGGTLYSVTATTVRKAVLDAFPWMTQPPYNINPTGIQQFPVTLFADQNYSYGKFLNGEYTMVTGTNLGLIKQVVDFIVNYQLGKPVQGGNSNPYSPLVYESFASDYSGNEYENAAYVMATINLGPQITIIPGIRYQALETSYTAQQTDKAGVENPYPRSFPHIDTTISQYHGYWLPDIILRYKPFPWLDFRAAYTNTLNYPDPSQITPVLDINIPDQSIVWHNFALEPARSQNFDLGLSIYNNEIGLLTLNGFVKRIDKLIFRSGIVYVNKLSDYPGLPSYTKGYSLNTSINNRYRVDLWGIELKWQTHFWYLPDPLKGLVLNVNYSHLFSQAKYPHLISHPGHYPDFTPTYVDSFYTDRLIHQPYNIINLSLGYDYIGFSAVVSVIYQADVFNTNNFWPEYRSDRAEYFRWDFVAKQGLPWFGLSVFLKLNNINSESDIFLARGNGLPQREKNYGMTADFGIRWRLK